MTELNITLNEEGHLYEQIYNQIKVEIQKGKLLRGERLPSTRLLADFLNVSRTTAIMAYDQLLSEGYIESRPQRGFFVCEIGKNVVEFSAPKSFSDSKKESRFSGTEVLSNDIDFSPRAIDMSAFPYATWKKINREILVDARSSMFSAGDPQGDPELRETIARYLQLARGVRCNAEQIVIGAGNDYLLMLLDQIIGHRKAAMEAATYKRAREIMEHFGYEMHIMPMDDGGLMIDALETSGANLVYVMPSHQYPTGIVMPIARRNELLAWAAKDENRYLIEDDYDSEFRYRGKPIPSLQASDRHDKVIYMGTFSKSIAPAIRVSYMVLPQCLLDQYHTGCGCFSSTVSRIDQSILTEFIRDGYFERYLNKMRRIYRDKHDLMLRELRDPDNEYIISGADAGLHLLLTSPGAGTEEELVKKIAEKGVKTYGLSEFCCGERRLLPALLQKPTVVLGYASLQEQEIADGCRKIKEAVKDGK